MSERERRHPRVLASIVGAPAAAGARPTPPAKLRSREEFLRKMRQLRQNGDERPLFAKAAELFCRQFAPDNLLELCVTWEDLCGVGITSARVCSSNAPAAGVSAWEVGELGAAYPQALDSDYVLPVAEDFVGCRFTFGDLRAAGIDVAWLDHKYPATPRDFWRKLNLRPEEWARLGC